MRARLLFVAAASCSMLLAAATPAHAQDVAGAANAFSRAQKAELSGDHDTAAELYELADSLAPAPEALRSALKARKAAGQLGSAAQHAEKLLRRYPNDKRSKDLAETTLEDAKKKLARIEVQCKPRSCGLIIDGAAGSAENSEQHVVFLEPGKHEINAAFGSDRATAKTTTTKAGERTTFTFEAPPPSATSPRVTEPSKSVTTSTSTDVTADRGTKSGRGLSPWIFATGAVLTAGLGVATVFSGLDVIDAHDAYQGKETQQAYDDGLDKERRTNLLIGATAVVGVATGVVAVFTRWGGSSESAATTNRVRLHAGGAPLPGGAAFTIGGNFQ